MTTAALSTTSSPERFIVKLKDSVNKNHHLAWLNPKLGAHSTITHNWAPGFLNGFAGTFSPHIAHLLRSNQDVEYIEEDVEGSTCDLVLQSDAPWGLSRINQDVTLSDQLEGTNYPYTYDSSAGAGVDVYILDCGVYINHRDFGGRARWGKTYIGTDKKDKDGHGTHVAGVVAGNRWGIAKLANIIAVKVMGDDGKGPMSNVISGMEWVVSEVAASGRPSAINMSLGSSKSKSVDEAVAKTTTAGVHVIVAAGNGNTDAKDYSPARAPSAITVGASDVYDKRCDYTKWGSNYGSVVNTFAPGNHITSCWIDGTNSTKSKSGTSMATPHVTGIVARLIAMNGNSSTSAMSTTIATLSAPGILTGIPDGTPNLLARCCIRTPASFYFKSNWAEVGVTTSRVSIRKIDNPDDSTYDNVTLTATSLRWGEADVRTYGNTTIPFLVVNDGSETDIYLSHGTDASEKDDAAGETSVNFANCDYLNAEETDNITNTKRFSPCPVKTETIPAIFFFESDWAEVGITTPGACVRKVDGISYDNITFTRTSLRWGQPQTRSYGNEQIVYNIVNPSVLADIYLSHGTDADDQGDQAGRAGTSFAARTYINAQETDNETNTLSFSDCPVETQWAPATFYYQSNWAEVGVTSRGASVQKDPSAPSGTYDNVTFTETSLKFGTELEQNYGSATIPFIVAGAFSLVDIYLAHGTDAIQSGDKAGNCSITLGNRNYVNETVGGVRNLLSYSECPMSTTIVDSTLALKSNWAEVVLPSPGASLRKDPTADDSVYDNTEITTTSLKWEDNQKYADKTIPFQILVPGSGTVDLSISHGSRATELGDGDGTATVHFGDHDYVNGQVTDNSSNTLLFTGCTA